MRRFLIDTNVLITAKNGPYAFDLVPKFWTELLRFHGSGNVFSIREVRDELMAGNDDLSDWVKRECPKPFFLKTDLVKIVETYRQYNVWVQGQPFRDFAKTDFARTDNADPWLIAHAEVRDMVVVTFEREEPNARRRIPIPNVCRQFGVAQIDLYEMMRELKFHL